MKTVAFELSWLQLKAVKADKARSCRHGSELAELRLLHVKTNAQNGKNELSFLPEQLLWAFHLAPCI